MYVCMKIVSILTYCGVYSILATHTLYDFVCILQLRFSCNIRFKYTVKTTPKSTITQYNNNKNLPLFDGQSTYKVYNDTRNGCRFCSQQCTYSNFNGISIRFFWLHFNDCFIFK